MTSQSHSTARFSNVVSPSLSRRNFPELLATLAFASFACFGSPAGAQAVSLGTATQYGVLAGSAVTNTGPSIVNGFLGISPNNASSVTGFPPGQVIGQTHFADAASLQAQNDLTTAYNDLASRSCGTTISADLGGQTLLPGVYCAATSMGLTGTLTLDAQGNPNALFIFQMGSTLTTASNSAVNVINSGQDCNVFWQVGSSATLGTTTDFKGSIVALSSITLNTGANVDGRVLARNGAVTLDGNGISVCSIGGGPQGGSTGIPTLSQWSMLMLAGVLILFGVVGFRRYTM
ncbi:MAG: IPTL-CTERM sorting domain-containing protein [Pseudomonadota bacterium]|nr:IPTL-CTERM sorting domain-containing protein [Pseudomonadota bacterium]